MIRINNVDIVIDYIPGTDKKALRIIKRKYKEKQSFILTNDDRECSTDVFENQETIADIERAIRNLKIHMDVK